MWHRRFIRGHSYSKADRYAGDKEVVNAMEEQSANWGMLMERADAASRKHLMDSKAYLYKDVKSNNVNNAKVKNYKFNTQFKEYDLQKFYDEKPPKGKRKFPQLVSKLFDNDSVHFFREPENASERSRSRGWHRAGSAEDADEHHSNLQDRSLSAYSERVT